MTRTEARNACKQGRPVVYNGIEYLYISAVIYKRGGPDGFKMLVELLDQNRNAVVIVEPERVQLKEGIERENGTAK